MTAHAPLNASLERGAIDGAAHDRFVQVVASERHAAWIFSDRIRDEYVLPAPGLRRTRIFTGERIGKIDSSHAPRAITFPNCATFAEVALDWLQQLVSERNDAILRAFTVSNDETPVLEIDIVHPQAQRFQQPQPRAVEQACD